MKKKFISILLIVFLLLLSSGCITDGDDESTTTTPPATTLPPTTTPAPTTPPATTLPPTTTPAPTTPPPTEAPSPSHTDVSVTEAKDMMVSVPDLYIIDVSENWEDGHIPGSANFPLGSSFDMAVFKLNKDTPYLIYADTTLNSNEAVDKMISVGFTNVYRLKGNLAAWVSEGYRLSEHIRVSSSAIRDGAAIPSKYTCDGGDYNPEILIADIPANAESLVVSVIDLDSPGGDFVHWIVWNIPVTEVIERDSLPGTVGRNDFKNNEYNGPCPPLDDITHHYEYTVYVLNSNLKLATGSTYSQVVSAMAGHVIDSNSFIGTYAAVPNPVGDGGCNCGG